jgi:predicted amidophosphoribosyltransferase
MSPRLLDTRNCPHCGDALPEPTPRMCPNCGGSVQQRHWKLGCLTTAPKVVLLAAAAWAIGAAIVEELTRYRILRS